MIKGFKVITLCGSTKFKKDFLKTSEQLALEGNIVLSIDIFSHNNNLYLTTDDEERLTKIHYAKIDMSDEIFVINKDGYIGESTRNEINYALKLGKKINYLE